MSDFARNLEHLIRSELSLYKAYLEALEVQRDALKSFKLKGFEERTKKINEICQQMEIAAKRRQALISAHHPESANQRLSVIVESFYPKDRALLEVSKTLKELAEKARRESHEFSQITNFALNMLHGGLSLIWSATQNVTKRYGPQGEVTESLSPTKSRKETLLKEL